MLIDRDPGARIGGQELSLSLPPFGTWSHDAAQWTAPERRPAPLGARIAWMLTGLVASFALGSLWLRVTPKFHERVLRELHDRPGMALLVTCGLGAIMRTLYTREPAHPARPAAPSTDPGAAPPPAQIAAQHGSA
jgi:hypothetical protein